MSSRFKRSQTVDNPSPTRTTNGKSAPLPTTNSKEPLDNNKKMSTEPLENNNDGKSTKSAGKKPPENNINDPENHSARSNNKKMSTSSTHKFLAEGRRKLSASAIIAGISSNISEAIRPRRNAKLSRWLSQHKRSSDEGGGGSCRPNNLPTSTSASSPTNNDVSPKRSVPLSVNSSADEDCSCGGTTGTTATTTLQQSAVNSPTGFIRKRYSFITRRPKWFSHSSAIEQQQKQKPGALKNSLRRKSHENAPTTSSSSAQISSPPPHPPCIFEKKIHRKKNNNYIFAFGLSYFLYFIFKYSH